MCVLDGENLTRQLRTHSRKTLEMAYLLLSAARTDASLAATLVATKVAKAKAAEKAAKLAAQLVAQDK